MAEEEHNQGTEYEMKEVQNTGHSHQWTVETDSAGWKVYSCTCGAGFGVPPGKGSE